ncbi:MAG: hypothetical protein M3Q07_28825 [Pseudobdellovibrionaceae bacterium]|nr:hypothetical protein [Pseudobdellovibrionaceae bacterium]
MPSARYASYADFVEWLESVADHVRIEEDRLISADRVCRLPIILRRAGWTTLDELQDAIDDPAYYGLMLIQAGRASVAVAQADDIIESKQIQKYMVRKTQGRAQLTYLQEKGKSRLGSRIRLRQSQLFFEEINERMQGWSAAYPLTQIFLSCTPKLKGAYYLALRAPAFAKDDPRWRRVPFMVRPPGQEEMLRIHRLLCRAEWL